MGREVRMVPPNWEHPKEQRFRPFPHMRYEEEYTPMFDRSLEQAWLEWQAEYSKWVEKEHDEIISEMIVKGRDGEYRKSEPYRSFCQWHGGPPDPDRYRPEWRDEDRTWYQCYETVSEGTPVSPPFATEEELIDYLATHGDFWDQKRRQEGRTNSMPCEPWGREAAERFVKGRWAPSMIVTSGPDGVTVQTPRDGGPFKGDR